MGIVERFSEATSASIPSVSHGSAEAKAMYRFFDNPSVRPESILRPHRDRTLARAEAYADVLLLQDTTEIDHSKHPATRGLGYLTCPHARGLLAHNLLCVGSEGVPLGLVGQWVWSRPVEDLGKRRSRHQRDTSEKESRRWLWGLWAAQRYFRNHPHAVVICDREGDLFDLYVKPRAANIDLLVRVREQRRLVDHPARYLGKALDAQPAQMKVRIAVPRADDRPSRTAELTLRWCQLRMQRPANYRGRSAEPAVKLWYLDAREESSPAGVKPIHWLLATTMHIGHQEDALRVLRWYTYRWRIESFHFVLKSGCGVERHRLETAPRLKRLLATLSIVAWRVLWLTYESRSNPEEPCTKVFSNDEWKVLQLALGDERTVSPPTLATALLQVARLGGFLARKHDGHPGAKVLWRGLRRLSDYAAGYRLALQIEDYG